MLLQMCCCYRCFNLWRRLVQNLVARFFGYKKFWVNLPCFLGVYVWYNRNPQNRSITLKGLKSWSKHSFILQVIRNFYYRWLMTCSAEIFWVNWLISWQNWLMQYCWQINSITSKQLKTEIRIEHMMVYWMVLIPMIFIWFSYSYYFYFLIC